MRSCRVVRMSSCQCQFPNCPGFDPSIGIRDVADETVQNNEHKKDPAKFRFTINHGHRNNGVISSTTKTNIVRNIKALYKVFKKSSRFPKIFTNLAKIPFVLCFVKQF